eukprot:m.695679 g.695679  ORF g.695679 m.695679 type:complete len:333 (-) comp22890_c0_seq10:931-1929(-)
MSVSNSARRKRYSFVATDLDGTFLAETTDMRVVPTEDNKSCFKHLAASQTQVAVITGRSCASAIEVMDSIEVDGYVISNHGAVIRGPKGGKSSRPVLWTNPIPESIIERVVQHAEKHDTAVMFYTHSGIMCTGKFDFSAQIPEGFPSLAAWFTRVGEPPVTQEGDPAFEHMSESDKKLARNYAAAQHQKRFHTFAEMLVYIRTHGVSVLKCIILAMPEVIDARLQDLRSSFSSSDCHTMGPFGAYYEVTANNTNKAEALRQLTKAIGKTIDDVVCFGDSYNDLEMLQEAGLGIAVANANDAAKQAAKKVSEFANHDSAVAKEIRQLLNEGLL